MEELVRKLHPLERKVLPFLASCESNHELVEKTNLQEVEVVRALQWLSNKEIVEIEKKEEETVSLDENGLKYKEQGFPEKQFLKAIEDEYLSLEDIKGKSGLSEEELKISMGQLKRNNFVDIRKEGNKLFVEITEDGKKALFDENEQEKLLKKDFPVALEELNKDVVNDLLKRKKILKVEKRVSTHYEITSKGKELLEQDITGEYHEKLTPAMLKDGSWKGKNFRAYDVTINVPKVNHGKKHMITEAMEYAKSIWRDMGFQEMTGNIVQTGFWDLDALFVPQDHPAREMQDTFYVENPKFGKISEKEIYKKVKAAHEDGGDTGSKGWGYKFDENTAKRLLLRTHTTVLSAQTIGKLKKSDLPAKFFSVNRVYRNESLDWKHLFEFHQIEGIVIDPDANFRNLVGYLKKFFKKMGFPDVRVRPGHFPYTEPSAEVEVWHPIKKQWIELGGSGVFRPELTKPLLGFECPVLAWGLGLERIITDYYGITDLRDIYNNDLKKLRNIKKFVK